MNYSMLALAAPAAEEPTIVFSLFAWVWKLLGYPNDVVYGVLYIISVVLCIVIPYLIGSINPAIIISRSYFDDDIRTHGSGNAGATNTLRTFGKKMAALIFCLDLLKAAIAVIIGSLILTRSVGGAIAGFFVILGHMFPIFYKFKGGKGVACTAMVMFLLSPASFVILFPVFVIIVLLTRFVSLGSIIAVMLFPLMNHIFYDRSEENNQAYITLSAFCIMFAVVFMHRENIKRLLEGKESKINFGKSKKKRQEEAERRALKAQADEKVYSDDDFTKCACGRLIPVTRKVCVYCGAKNTRFIPKNN